MTTEPTTTEVPEPGPADQNLSDTERRAFLRSLPGLHATPDPSMVATIPKGGVQLEYVGHADITLLLCKIDPEWRLLMGWETAAGPVDPFAMGPATMLCRLVLLGVERECVGTITEGKVGTESAIKELYGDALRNGAMRFGIATALWSKAQREGHDLDAGNGRRQERDDRPAWTIDQLRVRARQLVDAAGFEGEAAKDTARAMWGEVVGMRDGDAEFPAAEVDRLCADFDKWLKPDTEAGAS